MQSIARIPKSGQSRSSRLIRRLACAAANLTSAAPILTLAASIYVMATPAVASQDAADAQKKLLAKRAAEADAYRKLAECVYGIQLNERTTVRDFVTESDDIRSAVDTFIRGIRLGEPTYYADGSCEVPAEVTVAKLIETIREVHKTRYKGDHIKTSDFESVAQRTEKSVIKVLGMGAPREDLPPNLPEGVAQQLGAPPQPTNPAPPPIPDIWLRVGPQARLMAIRAARIDALRRLAERIKGLRLTSHTQVRDFAAESDVITAEMQTDLVGAQEIGTYLRGNELIAEVTLRVPTEQVITTVKKLHSRHYRGDDVKGTDVENVVRNVIKKDFEATGMGVPPPDYVRRYHQSAGVAAPDWSVNNIEAQGEATDPEVTSAQGKLRAARAAELIAKRNLAEHVAGLRLSPETAVRDFIAQYEVVRSEMDAIIADALVQNTRFTESTAVVTVTVPGLRVWSVFHEELSRGQRKP